MDTPPTMRCPITAKRPPSSSRLRRAGITVTDAPGRVASWDTFKYIKLTSEHGEKAKKIIREVIPFGLGKARPVCRGGVRQRGEGLMYQYVPWRYEVCEAVVRLSSVVHLALYVCDLRTPIALVAHDLHPQDSGPSPPFRQKKQQGHRFLQQSTVQQIAKLRVNFQRYTHSFI